MIWQRQNLPIGCLLRIATTRSSRLALAIVNVRFARAAHAASLASAIPGWTADGRFTFTAIRIAALFAPRMAARSRLAAIIVAASLFQRPGAGNCFGAIVIAAVFLDAVGHTYPAIKNSGISTSGDGERRKAADDEDCKAASSLRHGDLARWRRGP